LTQEACARRESGGTSGLSPAGGEAPGRGDVAVAAAAADLAKVLERVWRGSGSGEGAFAKALERTRASAAELRDAAVAAEMLEAAARHRDMVSSRSRFASRRLRGDGEGDGYGSLPWRAGSRGAGSSSRCDAAPLGSLTRRPSWHLVRSLSLRLGAVHLGPCAERLQPERNGTDAVRFAGSGPKRPKPKIQTRRSAYPLRRNCEHRREETEARRAIWGEERKWS
jgi:hypothetical protein